MWLKNQIHQNVVLVNKPNKQGCFENIIGDLMILGLSMIAGVILLKKRKEI